MAKHRSKHTDDKMERKKGGRIGLVAAGNPDVLEEANDDADGAETGNERKRGGRAKKKGKDVGEMHGKGVKSRLDRPGRKRGGAVGANRSPLSTAHKAGGSGEGSSNPTDTYGGTPS